MASGYHLGHSKNQQIKPGSTQHYWALESATFGGLTEQASSLGWALPGVALRLHEHYLWAPKPIPKTTCHISNLYIWKANKYIVIIDIFYGNERVQRGLLSASSLKHLGSVILLWYNYHSMWFSIRFRQRNSKKNLKTVTELLLRKPLSHFLFCFRGSCVPSGTWRDVRLKQETTSIGMKFKA